MPDRLGVYPFRGSDAIKAGLITRAMLRGPGWHRLFRDIYVRADSLDDVAWCLAAALLLPKGGAISGSSAALLWGVQPFPVAVIEVHVTVQRGTRVRPQPRLVVKHGSLPPDDVVEWLGIPVTTPLRTAFDLARELPCVDAVIVLDMFLHGKKLYADQLSAFIQRRSRWPGVDVARRALALADGRAESPMETRLRLLIVLAGLPTPIPQHVVLDAAGRFVARLDLAYPEDRLGIEYEGDHHRQRSTWTADLQRHNRLRLLGWTVLRFSAADVLGNPDKVLAQIRAALH